MRSLVGPLRQLTVHRLPPANGGLGQKCRRPLYLQLRSMVPQIRTSAFGLSRQCGMPINPSLGDCTNGFAISVAVRGIQSPQRISHYDFRRAEPGR